jgi:glyoxylase-like metal-dependent hydrolase (beta-lactamase superfamily II)
VIIIQKYTIKAVTPRTVIMTTDICNAGAITLNNFIVVIDPTMFPATAQSFRDDLEIKFKRQVKYLLITHYHGDHVFGAGPFKDTKIIGSNKLMEGMKVKLETQWSKEAFDEWIKREPEKKEDIESIEIIFPKISFENKYIIKDNDFQIEITHIGGHTAGSSYAYFSNEKVLFAGDLMFAESFPWAGDPTCNPDIWITAFENILKLDIKKIIPGHGPIVDKEEIKKHLIFFKELREETKEAISNNKTYEKIAVPDFYGSDEDWIIPETLKHWRKFYENLY